MKMQSEHALPLLSRRPPGLAYAHATLRAQPSPHCGKVYWVIAIHWAHQVVLSLLSASRATCARRLSSALPHTYIRTANPTRPSRYAAITCDHHTKRCVVYLVSTVLCVSLAACNSLPCYPVPATCVLHVSSDVAFHQVVNADQDPPKSSCCLLAGQALRSQGHAALVTIALMTCCPSAGRALNDNGGRGSE